MDMGLCPILMMIGPNSRMLSYLCNDREQTSSPLCIGFHCQMWDRNTEDCGLKQPPPTNGLEKEMAVLREQIVFLSGQVEKTISQKERRDDPNIFEKGSSWPSEPE